MADQPPPPPDPVVVARPRFHSEAELLRHFGLNEQSGWARSGSASPSASPLSARARRGRGKTTHARALRRLAARAAELNAAAAVVVGPGPGPVSPFDAGPAHQGAGLGTPSRTSLAATVWSPLARISPVGTPARPPARATPTRSGSLSASAPTPTASGILAAAGALAADEPDMAMFGVNPYGSFLSPSDAARLLAAAPAPVTRAGKLPRKRRGPGARGKPRVGVDGGLVVGGAGASHGEGPAHRGRRRRRGRAALVGGSAVHSQAGSSSMLASAAGDPDRDRRDWSRPWPSEASHTSRRSRNVSHDHRTPLPSSLASSGSAASAATTRATTTSFSTERRRSPRDGRASPAGKFRPMPSYAPRTPHRSPSSSAY
jgi:hypothetical protein